MLILLQNRQSFSIEILCRIFPNPAFFSFPPRFSEVEYVRTTLLSQRVRKRRMQYLVLTSDSGDIDWDRHSDTLKMESKHILSIYLKGILRNIWFTEKKDAILLFECDSIDAVNIEMNKLSLVSKALIKVSVQSFL
jgi:hypothetical protein